MFLANFSKDSQLILQYIVLHLSWNSVILNPKQHKVKLNETVYSSICPEDAPQAN